MKDKSITLAEVTEVLYGIENAVGRGEQFMKNAREKRTFLAIRMFNPEAARFGSLLGLCKIIFNIAKS